MPRISGILIVCLVALAAARPAAAQEPRAVPYGAVYDEGFVFFELENHQESVDGRPTDRGWSLDATARLVGEQVPNRSAFRFRMKQGGRELGDTRCELQGRGGQRYVRNCRDRNQRIQANGLVSIEVYFIDGDTDAETLIATHSIEVLQVTRVRGNGEPDAMQHYINQNGEVFRTILNLVPMREYGYGYPVTATRVNGSANTVELYIVTAASKSNRPDQPSEPMTSSGSRLRCRVDGAPVRFEHDQVTANDYRHATVVHTHGRGGRDERDIASYRFIRYRLPLQWGEHRIGENPAIDDHPGRWECEILLNGDLVRGFAFTVQSDGSVAPHPEEDAGLTLGFGARLCETRIADSEVFETRVDPAAIRRLGVAYGHIPSTPAARAEIDALPTLGTPVLPQPRATRGRDRGARRGR